MEQKEKLIELLAKSSAPYCVFCDALGSEECKECSEYRQLVTIEKQADHLFANGVVVLPCRCGECKKWDDDPDTYGSSDGPKGLCRKSFEIMTFDDFCSYGERKGGDK